MGSKIEHKISNPEILTIFVSNIFFHFCGGTLVNTKPASVSHDMIGLSLPHFFPLEFLGQGSPVDGHVHSGILVTPRASFTHRWFLGLTGGALGADTPERAGRRVAMSRKKKNGRKKYFK